VHKYVTVVQIIFSKTCEIMELLCETKHACFMVMCGLYLSCISFGEIFSDMFEKYSHVFGLWSNFGLKTNENGSHLIAYIIPVHIIGPLVIYVVLCKFRHHVSKEFKYIYVIVRLVP
jgi:hypothetical protein